MHIMLRIVLLDFLNMFVCLVRAGGTLY